MASSVSEAARGYFDQPAEADNGFDYASLTIAGIDRGDGGESDEASRGDGGESAGAGNRPRPRRRNRRHQAATGDASQEAEINLLPGVPSKRRRRKGEPELPDSTLFSLFSQRVFDVVSIWRGPHWAISPDEAQVLGGSEDQLVSFLPVSRDIVRYGILAATGALTGIAVFASRLRVDRELAKEQKLMRERGIER